MRGILLLLTALASSTRAAQAASYFPANGAAGINPGHTPGDHLSRAADAGSYTVTVTNASGTTISREAMLTVK